MENVYRLYVDIRAIDHYSNIFKNFSTTAKLAEAQMKNLQLAMRATGASGAQIRQLSKDLDGLARTREINKVAKDLTALGMTSDKIAELSIQMNKLAAAQDKVARGKSLLTKGGVMIGAGLGVAATLYEPIKNAAEVQQSMVGVQIATGANKNQLQQLYKNAMLGGLDTGLSSVMVAEVEKAMSQSGLPLNALLNKTVFDQYLKFSDLLYQRNGTPVDTAAAAAVQMSHEYQLYSDPKKLASFQNRLWQTLAVTHTGIQPFANIFSYFAGTANRLGIDANTALAIESYLIRSGLAGNGRSGGSDINNFLQRSASPASKEAAALMKQYGLVDKNGRSVFFDKNGNFVGLPGMIDIMHQFAQRFHGDKAAEVNAMKVIWGEQGGRMAMALAGSNAKDMNDLLQKQINAVPGVEKSQAMQMNTISGQLQRLKVGWQDTMTALGMPQLGSVMSFLKTINDIVKKIVQFELGHQALMKMIGDFAKLTACALVFRGAVIGLTGAANMLNGAFRLTHLAADFAKIGRDARSLISDFGKLGGTLRIVGRGIGAVGSWAGRITGLGAPARLLGGMARMGGRVYDAVGRRVGGLAVRVGSASLSGIKSAGSALRTFASSAARAAASYARLGAQFAKWSAAKMVSGLKLAGGALKSLASSALQTASSFAKLAAQVAIATARLVVNAARTVAVRVAEVAVSAATKTWTAVQAALDVVLNANPIGLIITAIGALITIIVLLITHWKQVIAWLQQVWQRFNSLSSVVKIAIAAFAPFISLPATIIAHWSQIVTWFQALPSKIASVGRNIVAGLWNGIASGTSWLRSHITGWIDSVVPGPIRKFLGIHSPSRLMMQYGDYVTQGLAMGITNGTRNVANASSKIAKAASISVPANNLQIGAIPKQFQSLGADIVKSLWAGMSSMGSWFGKNMSKWTSQYIANPIKSSVVIPGVSSQLFQPTLHLSNVPVNASVNSEQPSIGTNINIDKLVVQANDEATARAAAKAFLAELGRDARIRNMSSPLAPNKLAFR